MSNYEDKINKAKGKVIRNIIRTGKNVPTISENSAFLLNSINIAKVEIKKVNSYLAQLNHNLKILKQIQKEVK